jgi:hypothetical protein
MKLVTMDILVFAMVLVLPSLGLAEEKTPDAILKPSECQAKMHLISLSSFWGVL